MFRRPWRLVWFRWLLRRPSPESCSAPFGRGWPRRSCRRWPVCVRPEFAQCGQGYLESWGLALINIRWIFKHRIGGLPLAVLQAQVKAALTAGVAGNAADLLDQQYQRIAVAVETDVVQLLHMAGLFTLAPQF